MKAEKGMKTMKRKEKLTEKKATLMCGKGHGNGGDGDMKMVLVVAWRRHGKR